jgi:GPH family glycoside/pentoside/hexuronide:cation symporter
VTAAPQRLGSYAAFSLPLAMVALPVYLLVPAAYAARTGLALGDIGAALLAARLLAALADPWFGRRLALAGARYHRAIGLAAPLLLAAFALLLFPPASVHAGWWLFACLLGVNLSHGLATVAYQSWGAALGASAAVRARVSAAREACGLAGVMFACLFTAPGDGPILLACFAGLLAATVAVLLLRAGRAPGIAPPMQAPVRGGLAAALRPRPVRRLLAAYALNGLAAGVASALFLFYVRDRLQAPESAGPLLLLYFLSAAGSAALWARWAARLGEIRLWRRALWMGGLVFACAGLLQPGPWALPLFGAVCCLSGIALGADLTLPSAALAGLIGRAGDSGRESLYFGAWHLIAQLTLALASGIVLPLLAWAGYVPGSGEGGTWLALCYAGLPAALRLAAAGTLRNAGIDISEKERS